MATDSSYEEISLDSFKFQNGELISALDLVNLHSLEFSGDFQVTFDRTPNTDIAEPIVWHLYFSKGKIIFSSSEDIATNKVLRAIGNYLPSFRDRQQNLSSEMLKIITSSKEGKGFSLLRLLIEVTSKDELIDYKEVVQAIQNHILNELDYYLFLGSGSIRITPDNSMDNHRPVVGFDLEQIVSTMKRRKSQWRYLKTFIPSMSCRFRCNENSSQWQKVSQEKRSKIQQLVASGNNLAEIRHKLGEDNLKLAKTVAQLIRKELVIIDSKTDCNELELPLLLDESSEAGSPSAITLRKIAVINDSQLLLKQLKAIDKNQEYEIRCCSNPSVAIEFLSEFIPEVIFLDVNIDKVPGFRLVKSIRKVLKLHQIPLVLLTTKNTFITRQRAKWSKNIFLKKPLTEDEDIVFRQELRVLLTKILKSNQAEK